jgi:hypothetical protein
LRTIIILFEIFLLLTNYVFIIEAPGLCKKIDIAGMAHLGFIIIIDPGIQNYKTVLNHEKIHIEQQREYGNVLFYHVYVLHFLYNYAHFRDIDKSYENVYFEREAKKYEKKGARPKKYLTIEL